jgi:hypothetical protein
MRDIAVKDWPGLDAGTVKKLERCFVFSLKGFIAASQDRKRRAHLKAAGMKDRLIDVLARQAMLLIAALPEVTIHGILHGHIENTTEGVVWAVYQDGMSGYDGLHCLEKGDHLQVYDEDGEVRFDGFIEPNYTKGWREYPRNPGHGKPCALGMWVQWTQMAWEPDDWARLFMRPHLREGKGPALRAVLTINKKRKRT